MHRDRPDVPVFFITLFHLQYTPQYKLDWAQIRSKNPHSRKEKKKPFFKIWWPQIESGKDKYSSAQ